MNVDAETVALTLIASSGTARSMAYEALALAKSGDFEQSHNQIEEANKALLQAHETQTSLLVNEANGNHLPVDVLLVHAQDHLMTSILAVELIEEIIDLHKTIKSNTND